MAKNKIYIYGEIWAGYSAAEVRSQLMGIPEGNEVDVHIHSPGGSVNEGFAIHDILATSPHKITTIGEGLVGSIATVIFLAGTTRKLTKNSQFFIHLPIVNPDESLTASELREYAEMMDEFENMVLDFYADKLGLKTRKKKELYKLLERQTTMTSEEAIEFGFATELVEEILALAKFEGFNNNKNMASLAERLGLKKAKEIENLILTTESGVVLNVQTSEKHAEVGMEVLDSEGNKASDGEYFSPGMEKNITVKNGKIEKIEVREIKTKTEDVQALAPSKEWETSFTADITAKYTPVIEGVDANTEKIKAQQTFIEAQSKTIEDIKAKSEQELSVLKTELSDYKEEVEGVLNLINDKLKTVVSNYQPPSLNKFGDKVELTAEQLMEPQTPFEKRRAELNAKNSKK